MTTLYTTRDEAIQREIIEPIESGDATSGEFNIDAIADEVLTWHDGLGANHRFPDDIWGGAQGYSCEVDASEFWEIVMRHMLPHFVATLDEVEPEITVETDGEDIDLYEFNGHTCWPIIRYTPEKPEEWEPELYREALEDAGWRIIRDFPGPGSGESVMTAIVVPAL